MMSKQLAVSAALSIFLMSGYVVLGADLGGAGSNSDAAQLLAPQADSLEGEAGFLPSLHDLLS